MKKYLFLICAFIIGFYYTQTIRLMTYNIRLDTPNDKENQWINRLKIWSEQINFYEPDILGLQEVLPNQLNDIINQHTDYQYIGEGRDGNNTGEAVPILYSKKKYKILKQHTFWLSPTPNHPSKGWDAAYPRICTYGLFQNIKTKQRFWVFNTHLDHIGIEAKEKGLQLIIDSIKILNDQKYPIIVMGDFNSNPTEKWIKNFQNSYTDSYLTAKIHYGEAETFNGFEYIRKPNDRIDYIWVSSKIKVSKYATFNQSYQNHYPSDHFPVYIECDF